MQSSSRAPVLSATRTLDSCWIMDGHLSRRPWWLAAQVRGWQGRRERSYLGGTGATEDAARRVPAHPTRCGLCGRGPSSLRGLHDFGEAPVLGLRQRPGLDDPNDVARLRLVLLVVRVEALRTPDDLLVPR